MNKKNTSKTITLKPSAKRFFICLLVLQSLFTFQTKAQWAAMGTGANDIVYAVSPDVTNTGVYFGESFANVTGGKNYIRYWNGSTISNLNANAYVNGYIYAIAVSGTNIYVGGTFTTAKGVAGFNGIACWSTVSNTWSTLGTQTNPAYTYTNAGTYSVTLVAFNGHCGDTVTKTILIEEPEVLIIPNIFSPNGDAINDQFFITGSGISTLNVDIYNRWGQLVYTIKSVHQSWDGIMNNGNHASEGTYFYLLQATGYDGKEYKRDGPLTLVR